MRAIPHTLLASIVFLSGVAFAAVALAALLSLNISYLQEVFPGRVGLSTSLLNVTQVASALIAAVLFAAFAGLTYKPMMDGRLPVCPRVRHRPRQAVLYGVPARAGLRPGRERVGTQHALRQTSPGCPALPEF